MEGAGLWLRVEQSGTGESLQQHVEEIGHQDDDEIRDMIVSLNAAIKQP